MSSNTHFALAIHILACLALSDGAPMPSAKIAGSVGTHPAFLRELLGRLSAAGLVENRMGKGGGSCLARCPEQITLRDVYLAVESGPSVAMPHSTPSDKCPVGSRISCVLTGVMACVDEAIETSLSGTTLAQIMTQIQPCA